MGRLATARRIKTAGRPRQPLLRQNRRFSSPHPFGRAGLARFEPRRLVSTSQRRLPGENVCYLRNLGTDEPLTSMNGMPRGRATLIVITGTDRTDGTVSRPGQALVQDPVQILVTGQVRQAPG